MTAVATTGVVEVRLTVAEMAAAGHGAIQNWAAAQIQGQHHRFPHRDLWCHLIGGVAAETAVARYLGVFWSPSLFRQAGGAHDVGNCQVRWTRPPEGRLAIRDSDADHEWFVLVVGEPPALRLIGWIYGRDGKQAAYRRADPPPYFSVPQSALHPMATRPFD